MAKSIRNTTLNEKAILDKIFFIRSQKVMLDRDLAELYQVETKVFNQAVKRNSKRFPEDFMFRLEKREFDSLRSQFVTLEKGRGKYPKYLPYAFTEQGVAMLSSILNSELAINTNIRIIRVFTRMREALLTQKDILLKLEQLENKSDKHDENIQLIFQYLKQLLNPPQPPRRKIGFIQEDR